MGSSLILPRRFARQALSKGQRVRELAQTPKTTIDDLVARAKAIVLCWHCVPKFDHKRAGYYKDGRFPYVQGTCDGCRKYDVRSKLYIHESGLAGPGGKVRSGTVWTAH